MAWKFNCEDPNFQYWKVRRSDKVQGIRTFVWITHFGEGVPWYSYQHKKWVKDIAIENLGLDGGTDCLTCITFNDFVEHLNKHPELKTQGEIILCSRFEGYNVRARWEE
jgi:hypothetical protein